MKDMPISFAEKGVEACIVITYACNFSCRHCMFGCTKRSTGTIGFQEGCHIIDQFNRSPHFSGSISIVGGEPFLSYAVMRRLMKYGHAKYHNDFSITTNCSWATDVAVAEKKLKPLVSHGLNSLMISVDDYHLHFGSSEAVGNAITAAKKLNCNVQIHTVFSNGTRRKKELRRLFPKDTAGLVDSWTESSVIPVGRAVKGIRSEDVPCQWRTSIGSCSIFLSWTVHPGGEVSPCCSANLSDIMPFGNIFEEDFTSILARHSMNPILNAIGAHGGPYLLMKIMKDCGKATDLDKGYSNHCHACFEVLGREDVVKVCQEYLEGSKKELLLLRLHNSEQMLRYQYGKINEKNMYFPQYDVATKRFF